MCLSNSIIQHNYNYYCQGLHWCGRVSMRKLKLSFILSIHSFRYMIQRTQIYSNKGLKMPRHSPTCHSSSRCYRGRWSSPPWTGSPCLWRRWAAEYLSGAWWPMQRRCPGWLSVDRASTRVNRGTRQRTVITRPTACSYQRRPSRSVR